MSAVTIVHLVRKANGQGCFERFMDALWAHPPGVAYDLVLACKGFDEQPAGLATIRRYPDIGHDIGTYRRAALDATTGYVCFLNSFSRPLKANWLAMMLDVAQREDVGLVGCTSSKEAVPCAPFPNPHVRTNAFVMLRELFIELAPVDPTREECLAFEAGPNSLTRQVKARGLRAVTVPRRPFRWGNQRDLLVADNRTDDYQHAAPERRKFLQQLAWGETE